MTPETEAQPTPKSAELNQPFTLAVSESITITGTELTVIFEMVERDGRCPSGVECAEEGPVVIIVSAVLGDQDPTTFEMNLILHFADTYPNIVTYQGYEIELTAVDPFPEQPEELMNLPYTATLIVRQQ